MYIYIRQLNLTHQMVLIGIQSKGGNNAVDLGIEWIFGK